jgi:AcrR family transcriptional regulator
MSVGGAPKRSLAREAREARRSALLDEAAREFNKMGIASASLAEIARRVGLSRASLYNYCKDREDLATQTFLRSCVLTSRSISRAAMLPGLGLERVEAFLRLSLEFDQPPQAVLNEVSFLDEGRQAEVRKARSENVAGLSNLLEQGIADGSIRPCHVGLACETILGILSWSSLSQSWTQNSDETFAIRMAAAIPPMVIDGVAASHSGRLRAPPALDALLELRRSLEEEGRFDILARAGSRLFILRGIDGV